MKVSNYNFLYKIDSSDNWIIYNSKSGALCSINSSYYNVLSALEKQNQVIEDEECRKSLYSCGFVLEDNIDEIDLIRCALYKSRYNTSQLTLTIAPTMDCNFKCIYCFEQNRLHNSTMEPSVRDKLVSFIKEKAKDISTLHITWFGGEPLLEIDIIYELSQTIIMICKENNIKYISSIITNGYFLTPEVAHKLVECGIGDVQITLDGPEDIHDSRRPLAGGQGTFTRISNNVILCANIIKIIIRINTDIQNFKRTGEIVDLLRKEDVLDKITIYLGLVEAANDDYTMNVLSVEEYSKFNLSFMKDNHIDLMKIYPTPKGNFCTADKSNAFVIDPEGYLYKCWSDIGIVEKNVGSIMEENLLPNTKLCLDYLLYDPTSNDICKECKFLPICMGGCPHRRIEHFESCSDKKYILDEYLCECAKLIMSKGEE